MLTARTGCRDFQRWKHSRVLAWSLCKILAKC